MPNMKENRQKKRQLLLKLREKDLKQKLQRQLKQNKPELQLKSKQQPRLSRLVSPPKNKLLPKQKQL